MLTPCRPSVSRYDSDFRLVSYDNYFSPEHDAVGKLGVTLTSVFLTLIVCILANKFFAHWIVVNTIRLGTGVARSAGIHRNAFLATVPFLTFSINVVNWCPATVLCVLTENVL